MATPTGGIVGFGDSTGDVLFIEEDIEVKEIYIEYMEEWVLVRLDASSPEFSGPITVALQEGDAYMGFTWEALRERGEGPLEIPSRPE